MAFPVHPDLGMFTSGGLFELTDDHDLTVDGTLNAGTHTVELTTKGSGHDIAIDAKLEGSAVKLTSAATISESSAGDIDATTLGGSSVAPSSSPAPRTRSPISAPSRPAATTPSS